MCGMSGEDGGRKEVRGEATEQEPRGQSAT